MIRCYYSGINLSLTEQVNNDLPKKNELVNMYIKRQHIIDKILEPRHIIFVQKKNDPSLMFDVVLNSFLKEVETFKRDCLKTFQGKKT